MFDEKEGSFQNFSETFISKANALDKQRIPSNLTLKELLVSFSSDSLSEIEKETFQRSIQKAWKPEDRNLSDIAKKLNLESSERFPVAGIYHKKESSEKKPCLFVFQNFD